MKWVHANSQAFCVPKIQVIIFNKCSDRSMEVLLSDLLGPTNQETDMRIYLGKLHFQQKNISSESIIRGPVVYVCLYLRCVRKIVLQKKLFKRICDKIFPLKFTKGMFLRGMNCLNKRYLFPHSKWPPIKLFP